MANFVGLNKVVLGIKWKNEMKKKRRLSGERQKYRNDNNSSYKAPNEVIPKRGERYHSDIQFRLKNHLI